jgi:hypothetical protein
MGAGGICVPPFIFPHLRGSVDFTYRAVEECPLFDLEKIVLV